MKNKLYLVWILIPIFVLFASCELLVDEGDDPADEEEDPITYYWGGSSTVAGLVDGIKALYEDEYTTDIIAYTAESSSVSTQNLADEIWTIAGYSRPLKTTEIDQGVEAVQVAYLALAVIVSTDVGVDDLSTVQLLSIYDGTVTNWQDVGGNDLAITVYQYDYYDQLIGYSEAYMYRVAGEDDTAYTALMADPDAAGDVQVQTPEAMQQGVSGASGAIGFVPLSLLDDTDTGITVVSIGGVAPVLNRDTYVFAEELYIGYIGVPSETEFAGRFIDYLESDDGDIAITDAGYSPVP